MGNYTIVWVLFFLCVLFILSSYGRRLKQVNNFQKEQKSKYDENREKYRTFSSELFDQTPDEELTHAVLFHILAKEDKLYEGDEINTELKEVLTHGELLMYTIYKVELSIQGKNSSIHSFYLEDTYSAYRPFVQEAFLAVDCHEIAELMEAASSLANDVENEDRVDIDEDSIYGRYNFSDFTDSLASMLKTSGIVNKAAKYIRENKNDFIDMEEINNG